MKRLLLAILMLLGMAGVVQADITTGLVGYWPLTNQWVQNSTTVSDIGSGGNNGTVTDAVVGDDSTTFNGSSAYIDISDVATTLGDNVIAMSVSLWVKADTIANDGVISFGSFGGGHGEFDISTLGGASIRAIINSSTIQYAYKSFTDTASYHHVVVVFVASTSLSLYLDNSVFSDTEDIGSDLDFSGLSVRIGEFWDTSGTYKWDGQLSDVRIYNRALSSDDVAELYALGRNAMPNATVSGGSF